MGTSAVPSPAGIDGVPSPAVDPSGGITGGRAMPTLDYRRSTGGPVADMGAPVARVSAPPEMPQPAVDPSGGIAGAMRATAGPVQDPDAPIARNTQPRTGGAGSWRGWMQSPGMGRGGMFSNGRMLPPQHSVDSSPTGLRMRYSPMAVPGMGLSQHTGFVRSDVGTTDF